MVDVYGIVHEELLPMTSCVVQVPSTGNYLYGTVEHVTDRGMMIILTSRRRRWIEVYKYRQKDGVRKKVLANRYLTEWEELSPPRLLCAWQGKFVGIRGPK